MIGSADFIKPILSSATVDARRLFFHAGIGAPLSFRATLAAALRVDGFYLGVLALGTVLTSLRDVPCFGCDTKLSSGASVTAVKLDGVVCRNVLRGKISCGTVLTQLSVLLIRKITNRTDAALVRLVTVG